MASFKKLTSFLRDCLREERAGSGISNLFANKILNRRFLIGEETATSHEFSSLDLPPSVQEQLIQRTLLRGRESELLYAALPIVGKIQGRPVCAPLLLYPVLIANETLRVDLEDVRLNPAVLATFDLPLESAHDLLDLIPDGILNLVSPALLGKALQKSLPDLDLSPLDQFPTLLSSKEVQSRTSGEQLQILPASAIILAKRSTNVAGLLEELELIASIPEESYSPPLRAFIGEPQATSSQTEERGNPECIPALLSQSQLNLLKSINTFPLSVCQGPPGTGKSFSLVASAAEQILCGRSVLIACRSNEAADVLHQKLKELIPDSKIIVRAGRKKHLRHLREKIEKMLSSYDFAKPPGQDRGLNQLIDQIYRTESRIRDEVETALKTGDLFRNPPASWWDKARKWFHLKQLKNKPLLAEAFALFYKLHHARLREARQHNRHSHQVNLSKALRAQGTTKTLATYRDALKTIYASRQEKALHSLDPQSLFRVFPVWITTTDDLHRVLPFQPRLFDLAIIDEATQCDLASALPVLYRAKRALVSGDPKQLRHLSFLSAQKLSLLAKKNELSTTELEQFHYRKVSLIDRSIDQTLGTKAFTLLNEHFRSRPSLIHFSNEQFYHGDLRLMRETEILKKKQRQHQALVISHIGGIRDAKGINLREIKEAIQLCKSVPENTTLGFISPYRAQVDAFLETLQRSVKPDLLNKLIKTHRLVAGTSHSFQGDERDHIVLSLALDDNSPEGARRFAEREDVFNVAITRARDRMDVLHSLTPASLPTTSLLRRYLEQSAPSFSQGGRIETTLADLAPALSAIGWKPLPKNSLSGVPIDLLVERKGKIIAIDLIGTLGEEGQAVALSKSLILQRSGVPLYALRLDEWLHRKNKVIEFFHDID
ncbi:AAA domain-containing protein [Verrucomicrobiaceae bacterium 227]